LEEGNEYYLLTVRIQGKLRPKLGVRAIPPLPPWWNVIFEEIDKWLLLIGGGAAVARGNSIYSLLIALVGAARERVNGNIPNGSTQ